MKIATFVFKDQRRVGIVANDGESLTLLELPAGESHRGVSAVVDLMVNNGDLEASFGETVSLSDVRLLAPIPRPARNIICVGRNYHEHARELADSVFKDNDSGEPRWPIVFSKLPETVIAHGDPVMLPPASVSSQIDYEAELAVIIGKGGSNIQPEDVKDHIFGYTIVNDVTARDVQMRHKQWLLGKSFDTFCPMGPWVVSADEFVAEDTRVRCWVNDELRQDGLTRDLIFDIPTLIAHCSRGITLIPGDIIATGTPAGVGMGFDPPRFLKAGDRVRIEIDGIGTLENTFVGKD
ncbi:fumarylacetoacetate hydrolase family protein [Alcaligenaceae bacterium]|nr:fumarylacetoacetate hydrolase family protein [Alcaligenaceae bacterium]